MVSLLFLSHSKEIAKGVQELAKEVNKSNPIYAVGGTKDGATGADYDSTYEAVMKSLSDGEVIILFDLGSTLMTVQMILDDLPEDERSRVYLTDAALVEGAIVVSVGLEAGYSIEEALNELKKLSLNKL